MFLYMNINTGDFVVYKDKEDLDPNIFRFIREIKEVRISGERGCFLVSENTLTNDILSVV